MFPNLFEAKDQPCLSGNPACGREEGGRRLCSGPECLLAWRWKDPEDARPVVSDFRVVLAGADTPLRDIEIYDDEEPPEELADFLDGWTPGPPDRIHSWRLTGKHAANFESGGGWFLQAVFERDKSDAERHGWCGLAARPRA